MQSCSVAWGTLAAPGPGPATDPNMGLENANFGMIVFSLSVTDFLVVGNRVTMKGSSPLTKSALDEACFV